MQADPNDAQDRRAHKRGGSVLGLTIDLGFGPLDIVDWSLGGARLRGAGLALTVGDFATGTVSAAGHAGPFIADVVRIDPPHFDPRRTPDEISLRWLELPDAVLDAMIAAPPSQPETAISQISEEDPHG